MKVGDYVRTKYGIRKVIQIDNETTSKIRCYVLDKFYNECKICSSNYIYDEDIIKSSPNIIDLIEVGDYVNGREVRDVYDLGFGKCFCFKNEYGRHYDKTYKIKSILTKEMFSQMEYKVGE